MDIIKQITHSLHEGSPQNFNSSEDLNSTYWQKHPLELIEVQTQSRNQMIAKQQTCYELDQVSLVLTESKQGQEIPEQKGQFSPFVTKQLKKRIKKEAKYSSLETLTMRMLKDRRAYVGSKNLAKKNAIAEQKNYAIIALRLGFLYHYEMKNFGKSKEEVICWMFEYLTSNLEDCIKHKYLNNNSEAFVNLVKIKNMSDLAVFRKAMESNFSNFQQVNLLIQGLYEKKNDGSPSLKNQGFCEKVTEVLMGVILKGSAFRFGIRSQIERQFQENNKMETSQKKTEEAIDLQELFEVENGSELACLDIWNGVRQKSRYTIELFDLICPQQMDKYLRRQYETNTDLEYFSCRNNEDSFMAM